MNIHYRNTSGYYSGFQRINMFSDPVFRQCAYIIGGKIALMGTMKLFPVLDDFSSILTYVLYLFPLAIIITGGMSPAGWWKYAVFAAFASIGMGVAMIKGNDIYLLLLAPALFFLYQSLRGAPWVARKLGYLEKESVVKETALGILCGLLFALMVYISFARVAGMEFKLFSPSWYVMRAFECLCGYGPFLGMLYGLIMRRLLNLHIQLPLIIATNTILFFLWYTPSLIAYEGNIGEAIGGQFCGALLTQLVLGMAFYFCRSTRLILISYFLYYILYMSFI